MSKETIKYINEDCENILDEFGDIIGKLEAWQYRNSEYIDRYSTDINPLKHKLTILLINMEKDFSYIDPN